MPSIGKDWRAVRFVAFMLIGASLSSMSGCFCPLWSQDCGGRMESPGIDYVKYVITFRDAATGKQMIGVGGILVTLTFPEGPQTLRADLTGTFTLLASTKSLPTHVMVSVPGYEQWFIDIPNTYPGEKHFDALMKKAH